ncbi:ATP synthase subunit I [Variovorax sp. PAMC 28711]|uniref:ATP synthase subunit I n=1 Tax=Variovorax sp. PAMC 28711 TaxID=1795631 RepID=UPI00078C3279|nr:ATP synthase subunit I [Variovorax sp. PAMC 28711]AMM23558.1 hypothetical protein AX767_03730 [Variovorax sp. PAMC 28711]
MTMHELFASLIAAPLAVLLSVTGGAALGVIFYGGLWWTVRRAATFQRPGASMLTSMLLRMGVTLGGFYLVSGGELRRMLLCLLGFVLARVAVTWFTRLPRTPGRMHTESGVRHAP